MDNKQATPTELAYLAGIMDGEGSIMITKSSYNGKPTYACQVKITNTDTNLVERVQTIYLALGINPLIREWNNTQAKWKDWFDVFLTKRAHIQILLEALLPYLVAKRSRAVLMLRYVANQIEREEAHQQMKGLNRKGESSETTREAPAPLARDEDIVHAA